MKKQIILLLLILFSITIPAQTVTFEWAKSMGGNATDEGYSIVTDAAGNIYIGGSYERTVDFDPGGGTSNLSSEGSKDIFIQKFNSQGNLVWAKSMDGSSTDEGYSVQVDAAGNVYIAGVYQGTADFDPGGGTFNMTSNGSYDTFCAKLDANGNFIWAKSMGGSGDDFGNSMAIDAAGNVFGTGYFHGTADFDPGPGTFNLVSPGFPEIFIYSLDANGNFAWAKSVGGMGPDISESICTDAWGNVYVTGGFWFTADFDPGPGTFDLVANDFDDVFVLKLRGNGDFVWAKSIGGAAGDFGETISTDDWGNVFVSGEYVDTADFDPGIGTFELIANGDFEVFVLKLDSMGDFAWAKSVGGALGDFAQSVTADPAGSVYVAGNYQGTVDFDPGAATFNLSANGNEDAFLLKLDAAGNFMWAQSMGGSNRDGANSVTVDGSGVVYSTGYFMGTVDFDPLAGTSNLNSKGDWDVFLQKLSQDLQIGTGESLLFKEVTVYPNPNQGWVNIDLAGLKNVSLKVYSLNGQLLYQKENIKSSSQQFDFNVAAGVYILELKSEDQTIRYKLLKE